MQTRNATVRAAVVLGMCSALVACGQFNVLKGRKAFKEANAFYAQQDYKKAAEKYAEALGNDPNLSVAYFYLGNSYDNLYKPARQGEAENDVLLQKAIDNYQLAADKAPDPKIRKLALEYLVAAYGPDKLNDPEKQLPLIQKMIDVDPTDPANYFALAKIHEDNGNYDEAERVLMQARDKKPESTDVWMQLAGFYNRQGDFEKTIAALRERATREPNNPEAYYTIATYYWDKSYRDFRITEAQKTEYAKAGIEAVDQAIKLKPDYMEAVTYRGLLLRVLAAVEKDAGRQKALLRDAEAMQTQAVELRKKKAAGAS
jgi:tetratricopeptide (TPR) repeat protein